MRPAFSSRELTMQTKRSGTAAAVQAVAVDALERRAGGDGIPLLASSTAQRLSQPVEPCQLAVGVVEGGAGRHLGDVGRRMEGVALEERMPSARATPWPTVDLPQPHTPTTTTAAGAGELIGRQTGRRGRSRTASCRRRCLRGRCRPRP